MSVILALPLLLSTAAEAEDTHLDVTVGTQVPVSAGLRVDAELPQRLRAGLGIGLLPGPYLDLINDVAVGAGWYSEATAALIDAALQGALVLQLEMGWRPVERSGFHFAGGYQLGFLGGGLGQVEDDSASAGPGQSGDSQRAVEVSATLHMLTVGVGYDILVAEKLVVRPSLGGAFTVGSQSRAALEGGRSGAGDAALEGATEQLLDQTFRSYVHTPMLGLHVGYRFF